MEYSYLKLVSDSRVANYLGLRMDEGVAMRRAPHYLYLEVPARGFRSRTAEGTEEVTTEVKRNQHVFVEPACIIEPRGSYMFEIEPCIELGEFGQVQAGYKVHPGSGIQIPGFWFTARKDTKLSDLPYAIRIYMNS